MLAHAAHSIYFHCACHRLQLCSKQLTVFLRRKDVWNIGKHLEALLLLTKKAKFLNYVQSILKLLEPEIVMPSDTRWLSHERCVWTIFRELPALIIRQQQLYETSGDAELYGLSTLLAIYTGVATGAFLSEILA